MHGAANFVPRLRTGWFAVGVDEPRLGMPPAYRAPVFITSRVIQTLA